jgi:P-type Ca2+ transporter type 2C
MDLVQAHGVAPSERRRRGTVGPASQVEPDLLRGLDPDEAAARLARFGPNELSPQPRDHWWMRMLRQLREPMAILLMVAAAVAGIGLGEQVDAIAILAIVVLNAVIGVVQEGKAERALDALRSMETPLARLRRSGLPRTVPSREVVPGDVVLLSAGDRVPADVRLGGAASLELDESLLTGESLPVAKRVGAPKAAPGQVPIAERTWMAFSGTLVTRGSGEGVALVTGPDTEIGRIAERLRERQPPTPLQAELGRVTSRLGIICILIAGGVFGLTVLRTGVSGDSLQEAFLTAVALAVAAVPEGLATVVTVALALGVRRMAAQGAIVRRLPAVETLGSTTVIATDKTGTLTENRLRLESIAIASIPPAELDELRPAVRERVAEASVLCNDATILPAAGDPLDVALLEAFGPERVEDLRRTFPRLAGIPFDSDRRRMTTLHRGRGETFLLTKGAPETVVERCIEALDEEGRSSPLDDEQRSAALDAAARLATRGIRVLALARRSLPSAPEDLERAENVLTLVALVGLRDPVRPESRRAVAEATSAGIQLVMVTGDHPGTASAIAEEVGLASAGDHPLTGQMLRDAGFPADPAATSVYARVDPDQKLELVDALRAAGHVVAVTGDGVNDAPALRRAHIGVGMGRAGSDVAREASDMVITDDNLATIVTAVREGRGIFDNIRKVVDYLVAGNLSEITVVVGGLLLFPGLGVPLFPLQLLWINLLTDGLPALALGVDPVDPRVMKRPPRRVGARLLAGHRIARLYERALLIAGSSLVSLAIARYAWNEPWAHARAVMFTVLVVAHLLYGFTVRRPAHGTKPNLWLAFAVGLGIGLQLLIIAWPAARSLFDMAPLSLREWLLVAAGGALPAAAIRFVPPPSID